MWVPESVAVEIFMKNWRSNVVLKSKQLNKLLKLLILSLILISITIAHVEAAFEAHFINVGHVMLY